VQYFERARFEYHPEQRSPAWQIQLGLLGSEYARVRNLSPQLQAPVPAVTKLG